MLNIALTDDEKKEWKKWLAVDKSDIDTEDREESDLSNASEFYSGLQLKAQNLARQFRQGDGNNDVATVLDKLNSLVFPHMKDATAEAQATVDVLLSATAAAATAAAATSIEGETAIEAASNPEHSQSSVVVTDEDIDASLNEEENALIKNIPGSQDIVRGLKKKALESAAKLAKAESERAKAESERAKAESERAKAESGRARAELVSALGRIETSAILVASKVKEKDSLLGRMTQLTQAENTITTVYAREQSKKRKDLQKKAEIQYRGEAPFPQNMPDGIDSLVCNAEQVPDESPFSKTNLDKLWEEFDEQHRQWLTKIHEAYNDFIFKSTILDRPKSETETRETETGKRKAAGARPKKKRKGSSGGISVLAPGAEELVCLPLEKYKSEIKKSTDYLAEQFRLVVDKDKEPVADTRSQEDDSKPAAAAGKEHQSGEDKAEEAASEECRYFPGPRSQELEGAQPVFTCLLDAVGFMADNMHVQNFSPKQQPESPTPKHNGPDQASTNTAKYSPNTRLNRESAVLGPSGRFRFGDFVIQKNRQHIWVYMPDTLPVIIEIKAFYRTDKGWKELITNALQQILNHMSKYVRVGLNFSGAGVESFATGSIASLAYIQVYRLELKNPGTESLDLKIVKSELWPLMTKDTFERWINANSRSDETERVREAREELFSVTNGNDVPYGLLTIFQLMMSRKIELFGQTRIDDDDYQLIASGTFGNVYVYGNSAWKISRHRRKYHLLAEASAYKAVGHHKTQDTLGRCEHLAVAGLVDKAIIVGSMKTTIKALQITPAGTPLVQLGDISQAKDRLYKVVFDAALGLQHMHKHGVAHNDVSHANIIVVKDNAGSEKAVLVDLSLACPFTFEISLFLGNPVYVHCDIHRNKTWVPRPFHDMAALGFLAAVLASGSVVPWRGFSSPLKTAPKSETLLEDRRKVALQAISKLPKDEKRHLVEGWINLDKEKTIIRQPCTSDKGCPQCKCTKAKLKCLPDCVCQKNATLEYHAPDLAEIRYESAVKISNKAPPPQRHLRGEKEKLPPEYQ